MTGPEKPATTYVIAANMQMFRTWCLDNDRSPGDPTVRVLLAINPNGARGLRIREQDAVVRAYVPDCLDLRSTRGLEELERNIELARRTS